MMCFAKFWKPLLWANRNRVFLLNIRKEAVSQKKTVQKIELPLRASDIGLWFAMTVLLFFCVVWRNEFFENTFWWWFREETWIPVSFVRLKSEDGSTGTPGYSGFTGSFPGEIWSSVCLDKRTIDSTWVEAMPWMSIQHGNKSTPTVHGNISLRYTMKLLFLIARSN